MAAPIGQSNHGLVLQGGGALGAFELGAARAIFDPRSSFRPGVIAGVSIGAVTAVLLGRPRSGDPLATLEQFWRRVTVSSTWPAPLQPFASIFGLPNFYVFNWLCLLGTNFYWPAPLKATLEELVDVEALADPSAGPRLILTATDLEDGKLDTFDSLNGGLTLDHVLASGSLPPSFPATAIRSPQEASPRWYWDGGVFDNTPLGAVIDALNTKGGDGAILVANLFPNKMPLPANLMDVSQHVLNLLFANKTSSDVELLKRFNQVVLLLEDLKQLPAAAGVQDLKSYQDLLARNYALVPVILEVTREQPAGLMEGSDFSAAGIAARADHGFQQTVAELTAKGFW